MQSLHTDLLDRQLRFDGVSTVTPEQVARFLLLGAPLEKLRLTAHDADTLRFNEQVENGLRLGVDEPVTLNLEWKLPTEYLTLNLEEYFISKGGDFILSAGYTSAEQMAAMVRIAAELTEVNRRGMVEFFRTVIYILDTFRQRGVLWGVGRGSSCASYLLFIAGLHSVDCIKHDVPMEEFFHD